MTWKVSRLWDAAIGVLLFLIVFVGCDEDKRLAEMAQESTARQAEQNKEITQLNREVAESHQRLIEADAQSRQELVTLQHDMQAEQSTVGKQRDLLESERREWAQFRQRDPIIAASIKTVGWVAACLFVLALVYQAIVGRQR
jgi:hypothetical protein